MNAKNSTQLIEFANSGSIASQIFAGITIVILVYIVLNLLAFMFNRVVNVFVSTPLILDGMQSASTGFKVSQDPHRGNSKLLKRSANEKNGIEFTYSMWMNIDSWENQQPIWKHVLHKGPQYDMDVTKTKEPHEFCEIQAPGIWIHPNTNTIRVYMNTYDSVKEYVDIANLPIKKWFHIAIVLSHRNLDIYINGFLKRRLKLKGVPRQNYYDLHVSRDGGYQGHYSNIRYYNYAMSMTSLQLSVRNGPNFKSIQSNNGAKSGIPYLSNRWWTETD